MIQISNLSVAPLPKVLRQLEPQLMLRKLVHLQAHETQFSLEAMEVLSKICSETFLHLEARRAGLKHVPVLHNMVCTCTKLSANYLDLSMPCLFIQSEVL